MQIPEKFKNYHNCTLRVFSGIFKILLLDDAWQRFGIPIILPESIHKILSKRDDIELDFVQVFGQQGNFSINYTNFKPHMNFSTLTFQNLDGNLHFSMDYYQEEFTFVVTPAQTYSSYEKLVLPFDIITWICLISTFLIAFLSIFIVSKTSIGFQELFYGGQDQTPALNTLRIIFGSPLNKLPTNNFTRILLILFLYVCLVIRTAYQGVFFEMITTDIKKRTPQTLEEIIALNYTIYTIPKHRESTEAADYVIEIFRSYGYGER